MFTRYSDRCQSLDKEFEDFYLYWTPQLRRFLAWMEADATLIDDAVQETMLSALRYWGGLRHAEHPRAWLFKVVQQRLADLASRRSREVLCGDLPPPGACVTPHDAVDARLAIVALVRKLPRRQIAPVVLHFYGLSDQEIGQITDLTPASVRSYRCRALAVLRNMLPGDEEAGRP